MHDNIYLTQRKELNPHRILQNLMPDRKNQQFCLAGSIYGLI